MDDGRNTGASVECVLRPVCCDGRLILQCEVQFTLIPGRPPEFNRPCDFNLCNAELIWFTKVLMVAEVLNGIVLS